MGFEGVLRVGCDRDRRSFRMVALHQMEDRGIYRIAKGETGIRDSFENAKRRIGTRTRELEMTDEG